MPVFLVFVVLARVFLRGSVRLAATLVLMWTDDGADDGADSDRAALGGADTPALDLGRGLQLQYRPGSF